jgi:hypothetical protein
MSAQQAITVALRAGISIEVDGGDLVLEAPGESGSGSNPSAPTPCAFGLHAFVEGIYPRRHPGFEPELEETEHRLEHFTVGDVDPLHRAQFLPDCQSPSSERRWFNRTDGYAPFAS